MVQVWQQAHTKRYRTRGLSLVEVIVVSALVAVVFVGFAALAQTMLTLLGQARAESTALSLATERMEYIRSLPYDTIGTVSGVPSGLIPQNRAVLENKTAFNERVLIVYVDNDADGSGALDSNGILADYKQVKIEYTWNVRGRSHTLALVSDVTPVGIESTAGGGTIRVNVFDTAAAPVAGATVHFVNSSTSPAIDTIRYTTATGEAYLSGAPASAGYEIYVSKPGYSNDGTYTADATVVNPSTPPIAVLAAQVSTMNFQIDQVSALSIWTRDVATYASVTDVLSDATNLSVLTNMEVVGGNLALASSSGTYVASGQVLTTTTTPATIDRWYSFDANATIPSQTEMRAVFYAVSGGNATLIPDSNLPGNSVGFTLDTVVDLQSLSGAAYPSLAVALRASTTDTSVTPTVDDWTLSYVSSQATLPNVDLTVVGNKTYGTDASVQPVYQYDVATTTDGTGRLDLGDLASDAYTLAVTDPSYSVAELCPSSPLGLNPATYLDVFASLVTKQTFALRVVVATPNNLMIPGASVRLQNSGVDIAADTSLCGQTFFSGGLYNDSNYTVTVTHPLYSTQVITNVTINNDSSIVRVSMVP